LHRRGNAISSETPLQRPGHLLDMVLVLVRVDERQRHIHRDFNRARSAPLSAPAMIWVASRKPQKIRPSIPSVTA
jgi:hypothetical protein